MSKKIVVIGAGVIGITTAITLLEQNYKVTVISKDKPFATNSDIAVASWHPSSNKRPLLQRLCIESLPVFDELSKVAGSGVSWISVVKYMKTYDSYKENPWMKLVKSKAEFSPSIVTSEVYPYRLMLRVPLADVNFYRPFLFRLFEKLGGKLEQVKIESFTDLTGSYDAIINCSGWETKYLQRDARVHPIRGQTTILEVPADYKTPISFGNGHLNAYAIFRPESHDCVIGTTYKVNDCKTSISQKEREEIFAKVSAFIPDIRQFKVKQDKVGLRCGRQDVHIKSEWLSDTWLVHCYGHISSGFSASWASAKEVLKLCEAAFTTVL